MLSAHGKQAHVGAKISVRGDYEKIKLLHLGLRSLLKEGVVNHAAVGIRQHDKPRRECRIKNKHSRHLFL